MFTWFLFLEYFVNFVLFFGVLFFWSKEMEDQYSDRFNAWYKECVKIIEKENERRRNINIAAMLCMSSVVKAKMKKPYDRKRVWVDEILQQRKFHGFYEYIFPVLQKRQPRFNDYFRMSSTQFEELLCLVAPNIYKRFHIREPVSPGERLYITLRYLASGDSMNSIQYHFLRGLTTVSDIIGETCQAKWDCLHSLVLPTSLTTDNWMSIAKDFEELWNFPHCIGAIDGKHIMIQCPDNSGSAYYNYKGFHSIVLLAVCDANYKFTFVDIGAYGRGNDSSIFKNSTFGQKFVQKNMNLPKPAVLTADGPPLPYFLVGDEAFALTEYLLRPYPGRNITQEREIYNYRLSRARRTIENAFGILASQWRIFRRAIDCSVPTAERIVQTAVCLHNYLRRNDSESNGNEYITPDIIDGYSNGTYTPGTWRSLTNNWSFEDITNAGTNTSSRNAISIRDQFCAYFNGEGAVSWQYEDYN